MLPAAYWDAMLLARFPGKTLEELDGIDWPRLIRALQVREIDRVEELRELSLSKKAKPTRDEWRMILRHDRLLEAVDEQGE